MNIDWTVFDKYPEMIVECSCGRLYRSHIKYRDGQVHTRRPCPRCLSVVGHVRRARSEPETWTMGAMR